VWRSRATVPHAAAGSTQHALRQLVAGLTHAAPPCGVRCPETAPFAALVTAASSSAPCNML
jgi:hypothetical protein